MSLLLAQEFTQRGHELILVTETPNPDLDSYAFRVVRKPTARQLFDLVLSCDVLFQNNISLRTFWPALILRKPWIVRHATWIRRGNGSLGWQDRLKRSLLRFSTGISNSQAVADDLPVATTVIGNPYRDDVFRMLPDVARDRDIVFLGRLVSDKGPQLLLEAIQRLATRGLKPTVTFIGAGPELEGLQRSANESGLGRQVAFVGQKSGAELVELLNRHRIMAVPSVWNEPFGIVALEGIACGCAVVGSRGGGLKDAIGPCGVTFENGDAEGLTAALDCLLGDPKEIAALLEHSADHLRKHTAKYVADRYLEVVSKAVAFS